MSTVRDESNGRSDEWVVKQQKRTFSTWLKKQALSDGYSTEEKTLRMLADGPSSTVTTWQAYDISGYTFYTSAKDSNSAVYQNSGVRIEAIDALGHTTSYYGIIEDIWELNYRGNIRIPVFRCKWIKASELDNYGFTLVDLGNVGYKDDPRVLAERVAQVFYVIDLEKGKKHIVISGKQRILGVDGVTDVEDYNKYEELELFTDLPQRMKRLENNINKSVKPWVRTDCAGKIVNG